MRNDQIDDCNPVEVATARLNTKIPAERPLARRRDNKKMLFLHNRIFASSTNASFFFFSNFVPQATFAHCTTHLTIPYHVDVNERR